MRLPGCKIWVFKINLTVWWQVSSWFCTWCLLAYLYSTVHVLGSVKPMRVCVPSPLTTHKEPGTGCRHVDGITGAQRQRCTATSTWAVCATRSQVPLIFLMLGFTVWSKQAFMPLMFFNISLSLDIATSSNMDKGLFVRLYSFSAGMTGGNRGLIQINPDLKQVVSGIWSNFPPRTNNFT